MALYGRNRRWALTERGTASVERGRDHLSIGPSGLTWDGSALTIQIDETSVPIPRRIRGAVRLYPQAVETRVMNLDPGGFHRWGPIAACARVKVALDTPGLSWSGPAYFDSNSGDRALETDFLRWDWCRAPLQDGAAVLYDVTRRDGTSSASLALRYRQSGGVSDFEPPPTQALPFTRWRVKRQTGSEAGANPTVLQTLEDTPFYARSVVSTQLLGSPVTAMHESLSLDRFKSPWVQAMLPFRMPRLSGGASKR